MINIVELVKDLYVVYKNNERITPIPLTREELDQFIAGLSLSEEERAFVDHFYGIT